MTHPTERVMLRVRTHSSESHDALVSDVLPALFARPRSAYDTPNQAIRIKRGLASARTVGDALGSYAFDVTYYLYYEVQGTKVPEQPSPQTAAHVANQFKLAREAYFRTHEGSIPGMHATARDQRWVCRPPTPVAKLHVQLAQRLAQGSTVEETSAYTKLLRDYTKLLSAMEELQETIPSGHEFLRDFVKDALKGACRWVTLPH